MTQEMIVKRLSLIKALYRQGVNQSMLPDTISFSAVLTMHDSMDMFMQLVAERIEKEKGKSLMMYFGIVPELTMKVSIDKINKLRNNLKHNGVIPGRIEIEDTCTIARLFFEENTKLIFDLSFSDISLVNLIQYELVRIFLIQTEQHFEKSRFDQAAESAAKAYFHLLHILNSKRSSSERNPWLNESPQPLYKGGKFYTKGSEIFFEGMEQQLLEPKIEDGYVEVSEGVAAISYRTNQAISYLNRMVESLSMGFDFRRFSYFDSFMPQVVRFNRDSNHYTIAVRLNRDTKHYSKEQIQFAIDFITDFSFRLQELKY